MQDRALENGRQISTLPLGAILVSIWLGEKAYQEKVYKIVNVNSSAEVRKDGEGFNLLKGQYIARFD